MDDIWQHINGWLGGWQPVNIFIDIKIVFSQCEHPMKYGYLNQWSVGYVVIILKV